MSNRDIKNGQWININTAQEHKQIMSKARVQDGKFDKPGKYYKLSYRQRCPKGCCMDDVIELIPKDKALQELQDECAELFFKMNPDGVIGDWAKNESLCNNMEITH